MSFRTTRWSLLTRALRPDDDGRKALEELCAIYWPAVYAMYRREGEAADAAEDLTQGLFASLLEREDFSRASEERGRFRAFLRTCARNFASAEGRRDRAAKRGGGRMVWSLDAVAPEGRAQEERRAQLDPVDHLDAAAVFERRWAQTLIESVMDQLAQREATAGRTAVFEQLRPALEGEVPMGGWGAVAEAAGASEGALRVAAHRLRQRFREMLLAEVRETVDDPALEGAEMEALLRALHS